MKKRKLYRIGNSKEPILGQLKRMTSNLQTARGEYANIEVRVWKHDEGSHEVDYWFGVGGKHLLNSSIKPWPEVLATYRKLMKEAKDV